MPHLRTNAVVRGADDEPTAAPAALFSITIQMTWSYRVGRGAPMHGRAEVTCGRAGTELVAGEGVADVEVTTALPDDAVGPETDGRGPGTEQAASDTMATATITWPGPSTRAGRTLPG